LCGFFRSFFHLFSHVSSSLSIPTLAVHLAYTPRISLILPTLDCLLPSDLPSRITGLNTFVFAGGFKFVEEISMLSELC